MQKHHKSDATPGASLDDLREELIRRTAEVTTALLGPPDHESRRELRWGRKGSLCVKIENGLWIDHESGEGGSLLDLIMREQACDIGEAIKWSREFCGVRVRPDNISAKRQPREPVYAKEKDVNTHRTEHNSKRALQIFRDGTDLDHPIAQRYLDRRKLMLPRDLSHALRFNLRCPFEREGGQRDNDNVIITHTDYVPALVALFRDVHTDQPRAIIRIELSTEGEKIGPMALGPWGGCACKLTPDEDVTYGLHVAEGVETAIASMMLGFAPMWALGFASGIAKLPVLSGIECLNIMVDNDKRNPKTGRIPGPDAARECSARWRAAGVQVRRLVPKIAGDDFADVVEKRREVAHA